MKFLFYVALVVFSFISISNASAKSNANHHNATPMSSKAIKPIAQVRKAHLTDGALNGLAYALDDHKNYGYNLDNYFKPASTEKIITALAALLFLGPNYQIKTRLLVNEKAIDANNHLKVNKGVLHGDIEIEFRGDPTLTRTNIRELLNSLKQSGIHTINGNVYINYGYYAGHDYASGWSWDDLSKCFTAPPSAVIIDGNCTSVKLLATQLGSEVKVDIPAGMPISVDASALEIVTPQEYYGGCDIELDRDSRNVYRLSGCIPIQKKNAPLGLSLAIQDPNQWGIDIINRILVGLNIKVYGDIQAARKTNGNFVQYATYNSKPISTMLDKCLKRSINLYADSIAKTIGSEYYGRPANYYMSSIAIRNILKKHNIDIGNATIIDGSGLSAHNYITPRQMLNVLNYIKKNNDKLHLIELLPVAGVSGTLGGRGSVMKPPLLKNVTAKTGTLNGVSNLAGFITTNTGKLVPFVYFVNNLSYDEKTRQKIEAHSIAKPHYPHEKMVLESIYNEEIITSVP